MAGSNSLKVSSILYMLIGIVLIIGIMVFSPPAVVYLILILLGVVIFSDGLLAFIAWRGEQIIVNDPENDSL